MPSMPAYSHTPMSLCALSTKVTVPRNWNCVPLSVTTVPPAAGPTSGTMAAMTGSATSSS